MNLQIVFRSLLSFLIYMRNLFYFYKNRKYKSELLKTKTEKKKKKEKWNQLNFRNNTECNMRRVSSIFLCQILHVLTLGDSRRARKKEFLEEIVKNGRILESWLSYTETTLTHFMLFITISGFHWIFQKRKKTIEIQAL